MSIYCVENVFAYNILHFAQSFGYPERGERRTPTINTVIKKRSIEDFEIFPSKYIEKVMAENALLERAVNLILQNEKTEKTLVEKILESAGTECFTKFDDGTYAWKGL